MWEVIFSVSDSKWIVESLAFSVPWLAFAIFSTFVLYKKTSRKDVASIGAIFIIIGILINLLSVHYYFLDKYQLTAGQYKQVTGVATNVIDDVRDSRFEVGGQKFSGGDFSQWIEPSSDIVKTLKTSQKVRVYYVPEAQHGAFPPGNKILQIEVCCTPQMTVVASQ